MLKSGVSLVQIRLIALLISLIAMQPVYAVETRLEWAKKLLLSTTNSGVVTEVQAEPGDRVKKGQLLIQLEARHHQARFEQAKASVALQERLLKEAERELQRNIELYERTVLSDHEKEMAHIQFARANTSHKAALAELIRAQLRLEYATIKAPFDAVVVRRFVDKGQTIINNEKTTPLVEIAALGIMHVRVRVAESALQPLTVGQRLKLTVRKKIYSAVISSIALEPLESDPQMYEVQIEFDTKGDLLRAGIPAKVSLP